MVYRLNDPKCPKCPKCGSPLKIENGEIRCTLCMFVDKELTEKYDSLLQEFSQYVSDLLGGKQEIPSCGLMAEKIVRKLRELKNPERRQVEVTAVTNDAVEVKFPVTEEMLPALLQPVIEGFLRKYNFNYSKEHIPDMERLFNEYALAESGIAFTLRIDDQTDDWWKIKENAERGMTVKELHELVTFNFLSPSGQVLCEGKIG